MYEPTKMIATYSGYLFGHYDSRGGATFVVAPDEMSARASYIEMGIGYEEIMKDAAEWMQEHHPDTFWSELHDLRNDREAAIRKITEEDFIDSVTVESYRELRDGEDIEYGEITDPHKLELERAFQEGLQWADDEVAKTVPNGFTETLWYNESTKTLRLTPPGESPREPYKGTWAGNASYEIHPAPQIDTNWVKSEFGEDACGVIFCAAENKE
jgi:hypothetical protein